MTSGSTEEVPGDIDDAAPSLRSADSQPGGLGAERAAAGLASPADPAGLEYATAEPTAPADGDEAGAPDFPADAFRPDADIPADGLPAGDDPEPDPDATRLDSRALDLRSPSDFVAADPDATRPDSDGLPLSTGATAIASEHPSDSGATQLTPGATQLTADATQPTPEEAFDPDATRLGGTRIEVPGPVGAPAPAPGRSVSRAASARRVLTPGAMLDDRYHLVAVAAVRGPVTLWRGDDRILARAVAVRVIEHGPDRPDGGEDPGSVEDSDGEALDRAADVLLSAAINSGRLVHPGAASTYDATTIDSTTGRISYVVSEWVEGVSLARLLSDGPMRPQRAAAIVLAAARVVAAAHARGLIHGDLHPDDVIVSGHGPVKVTDLEIGAAVAEIGGDPGDISPADVPDGRDRDLLALGALLYAALTARWPLAADRGLPAPPTVPDGRICTPRQVRAGVPRELEAVTLAAMGDDRSHRQALPSAAALVAELEQLAPPGDELLDPDAAEDFANQPMGVLHTRDAQIRTNQTRPVRPRGSHAQGSRSPEARAPRTQAPRTPSQGGRPVGPPTQGTRTPAGPGQGGYATTGYPSPGYGAGGGLGEPAPGYGPAGYGTSAYQTPGYQTGPRYLDPRRTPPDVGGRRPGPPPRRRSVAVPLIAFITVVAVVAIIIVAVRKTNGGSPGSGASTSPTVAASAAALPTPQVNAFDPLPGDGVEGNSHLSDLIDGNPATTWQTEQYNQQITATKAGVGVIFDFGSAVRPRTLTIRGLQGATTFEVRAGDSAPTRVTAVTAFPKIAGPTTLSTGDTIQIAASEAHRYWLVWLTALPLVNGKYQATIGEITFRS
ncbi:MAG: hypothetical protein ACQSGP_28965 [Frankia sp.]